jgi:hypothetical protein
MRLSLSIAPEIEFRVESQLESTSLTTITAEFMIAEVSLCCPKFKDPLRDLALEIHAQDRIGFHFGSRYTEKKLEI